MATIKELYDTKKDLPDVNGRILDLAKVDANAAIDQTPYSVGTNKAGGKGPDEAGISAVEGNPLSFSPGNRYGYQGAALGSGYIEWPKFKDGSERATWTDASPYGNSPRI